MNIEKWKNRWTVRRFDTSYIPEKEKIAHLRKMFEYIPAQLGTIDHIWTVLGPNKKQLKEWLVHNYYHTFDENTGMKEYFTALIDAPYVFHSFKITYPQGYLDRIPKSTEATRNNAFHAGCLVNEALSIGLDVAQIACTDGLVSSKKDVTPTYKQKMWDLHRDLFLRIRPDLDLYKEDIIGIPLISVGVGKGVPNTKQDYTPYKDGQTFTGQKQKKPFNNCFENVDKTM